MITCKGVDYGFFALLVIALPLVALGAAAIADLRIRRSLENISFSIVYFCMLSFVLYDLSVDCSISVRLLDH